MNRPVSRTLDPSRADALAALFRAHGQQPGAQPTNVHVRFEVRTAQRSIFTLYNSGKLVSTVRAGDSEAAALEAAVAEFVGSPAGAGAGREPSAAPGAPRGAPRARRGRPARERPTAPEPGAAETLACGLSRGTRRGLAWLAGADETGTGELIGSAVVGAALLPAALADTAAAIAGHVDTKSKRAASGWEDLATALAGLRSEGLQLATLTLPNRLFDAWSKNDLLDLAYVRLFGDLRALLPGGAQSQPVGLEFVIDDYGLNATLTEAVTGWRGAGVHVLVATRADDNHIAARLAAVAARATRSREMSGLLAEHGRLGTGNAGNPQTLAWMAAAARRSRDWPSFVKASFRTARDLHGLPEVTKRRPPTPAHLLDADSAAALLLGCLDVERARVRDGQGRARARLLVTPQGPLVPAGAEGPADADTPLFAESAPAARAAARWRAAGPGWELLPVLVGGVVLDPSLVARWARDPGLLDPLLAREDGLLSGWRVLVGPSASAEESVVLTALARAHRAGVLTVVPTAEPEPVSRSRRQAAVLLMDSRDDDADPGSGPLRLALAPPGAPYQPS